MPETWTTAQAALIVDQPLDVFQKIVERAPAKPKLRQHGGRQMRAFELGELVFFAALHELKKDLTPKKLAEAYEALRRVPAHGSFRRVEIGRLTYDFGPHVDVVRSKIEVGRTRHDLIDLSGPEPLIRGTTIEAYRIAALDMSAGDIVKDYPSLDEDKVMAARAYAQTHPKAGRPFPKITAKRALQRARVPAADEFLPTRG